MAEGSDWRRSLFEAATGPAIALLFWMQMIVIVLLAMGHGKLFDANIFEAFGAIGQVAFAGAVFWLGLQQFRFSREVSERQRRFELHDRRSRLIEEQISWSKRWVYGDVQNSDSRTLMALALRAKALFSPKVRNLFWRLIEAYAAAHDKDESAADAKSGRRAGHSAILKKITNIDGMLQAQMLVEIDSAPDGSGIPDFDLGDDEQVGVSPRDAEQSQKPN